MFSRWKQITVFIVSKMHTTKCRLLHFHLSNIYNYLFLIIFRCKVSVEGFRNIERHSSANSYTLRTTDSNKPSFYLKYMKKNLITWNICDSTWQWIVNGTRSSLNSPRTMQFPEHDPFFFQHGSYHGTNFWQHGDLLSAFYYYVDR